MRAGGYPACCHSRSDADFGLELKLLVFRLQYEREWWTGVVGRCTDEVGRNHHCLAEAGDRLFCWCEDMLTNWSNQGLLLGVCNCRNVRRDLLKPLFSYEHEWWTGVVGRPSLLSRGELVWLKEGCRSTMDCVLVYMKRCRVQVEEEGVLTQEIMIDLWISKRQCDADPKISYHSNCETDHYGGCSNRL